MNQLGELLDLTTSKDFMSATLRFKSEYDHDTLAVNDIKQFLTDHSIVYGIDEQVLEQIANHTSQEYFPIKIASGLPPVNGENGKIHYLNEHRDFIDYGEKKNFRDVRKISTIKTGEKIAYTTPPSNGENGMNIYGKIIKAKPGKPIKVRPGKNVSFLEADQSFIALADGQLSIGDKVIHVYSTYEVKGDLSLKNGNLDFVGSITIHGNVPTGYTVKADGDIHIYGLVESAHIEAGGSVFISEGISGLKKGTVIAGVDIKVGYINQAIIDAGRDIVVQNSILHSHCVAQEHIYCHNGNIIGGMLSAGKTIETRDLGNRMNTQTELSFGINKKLRELEKDLLNQKEEQLANKVKLQLLGDNLRAKENTAAGLTVKERILLLKQRNTMEQSLHKIEELNNELGELHVKIGNLEGMKLIVKGSMYPNVHLNFGKYKKSITIIHKYVQVNLDNREVTIQSL